MAPKGISMAGDEHRFDFPSLILDHKPRSKKTVTLIDLDVDVYGLDEIRKRKLPICAVVSFRSRSRPSPLPVADAPGAVGHGASDLDSDHCMGSSQILSHGRCHSAKMMGTMASGILGELDRLQAEGRREKVRDVIVITLVSDRPPCFSPRGPPGAIKAVNFRKGEAVGVGCSSQLTTRPPSTGRAVLSSGLPSA